MRSSLIESRPASNANSYQRRTTPQPQRPPTSPPGTRPKPRRMNLIPSEGWLPLLLLAIAVYSVVYSVTAAITISHSSVLWITTALGLLGGLIVSKSRYFPQAVLHIAACILGYWLALFLTSFLAYHVSLLAILVSLRTVISNGFALTGTQDSDMVFLFYLSFLCFFLGYFGSWLIYRAHLPWLVALVYISIMIVNLNYISKRDLSFLIIILVGALILLIARVHLASQLTQWKNEGLYTDRIWLHNLTMRFLRIVGLFVLLILPFSWLLPVVSQPDVGVTFWNNLDNAWANLSHGNLPSLTNPSGLFDPYQPAANFFGDQLSITGNVNLPNGPVLSYTTSSSSKGQYLEGFSFDRFDGHTWVALVTGASQTYTPNTQLPLDNTSTNYSSLTTSVTVLQPPGGTKHYIFAPAQPSNFTVPITLFTDTTGNFISAWTQSTPLQQNEHYRVMSAISNATSADLSTIPFPIANLSTWTSDLNYSTLQQYYLQTPKDLSPEVLATARTWTRGLTTMYDVVSELQAHLNNATDFTYSVSNPPVPSNIDAVTWLLHTHKGYCTYYATAMVMMARLLGIPARIVNGFSQGHYDTTQKAWIVDGSDAHSWVQIYFPGSGWINFDPTPGFSSSSTNHPTPAPKPNPTTPPVSSNPTTTPHKQGTQSAQPTPPAQQGNDIHTQGPSDNLAGANLLLTISLVILFCSFVVLGLAVIRYQRTSRSMHSPITSIYARLCRIAGLVGSPPASWQTPYEYTFALSRRFPQVSTALRRVADLFVRERWASPQQVPMTAEERELERLWPHLRNTILRAPFSKGR